MLTVYVVLRCMYFYFALVLLAAVAYVLYMRWRKIKIKKKKTLLTDFELVSYLFLFNAIYSDIHHGLALVFWSNGPYDGDWTVNYFVFILTFDRDGKKGTEDHNHRVVGPCKGLPHETRILNVCTIAKGTKTGALQCIYAIAIDAIRFCFYFLTFAIINNGANGAPHLMFILNLSTLLYIEEKRAKK